MSTSAPTTSITTPRARAHTHTHTHSQNTRLGRVKKVVGKFYVGTPVNPRRERERERERILWNKVDRRRSKTRSRHTQKAETTLILTEQTQNVCNYCGAKLLYSPRLDIDSVVLLKTTVLVNLSLCLGPTGRANTKTVLHCLLKNKNKPGV